MKETDIISCKYFVIGHLEIQPRHILPDSPESSQRGPLYLLDAGTKHDAHYHAVCWNHNQSRIQPQSQPAYFLSDSTI